MTLSQRSLFIPIASNAIHKKISVACLIQEKPSHSSKISQQMAKQ